MIFQPQKAFGKLEWVLMKWLCYAILVVDQLTRQVYVEGFPEKGMDVRYG